MDTNDSDQQVELLKNTIYSIKAEITSLASRQEHMIELVLGMYYSIDNSDYKDFAYVFFDNQNELSFDKKIKMLERFLKRKFPKILKENQDFIKQLHRVRKLRNKFAHSINLVENELKQYVGKSYFELYFVEEGISKREQFQWDNITSRLDDLTKIGDQVEEIFQIIIKKHDSIKK